jgi:hypothetical protein
VRSLVTGNSLDVVVESRVEAGSGEVRLGVLLEGLAVEGVLEVLEGQSVVEDVGCNLVLADIHHNNDDDHDDDHLCDESDIPSVTPARFSRGAAATRLVAEKRRAALETNILIDFD